MTNTSGQTTYRPYRALVPECARHDIGKTTAYELVKEGLLETFAIGRKRYVYLDSLASLPQRLASRSAVQS